MFFDSIDEIPSGYWRWENFSPKELRCKGTGRLLVNEAALDALQATRTAIGKPFYITSGYRSPEHNAAVGGAKNSFHLRGMAFDVRTGNLDRTELVRVARQNGFNGIGYYTNFIHIDTGRARVWYG